MGAAGEFEMAYLSFLQKDKILKDNCFSQLLWVPFEVLRRHLQEHDLRSLWLARVLLIYPSLNTNCQQAFDQVFAKMARRVSLSGPRTPKVA